MANLEVKKGISLLKPSVKKMITKTVREGDTSEILKYLAEEGCIYGNFVSSLPNTSGDAVSFTNIHQSKGQIYHGDELSCNPSRDCNNEASFDSLLSLPSQEGVESFPQVSAGEVPNSSSMINCDADPKTQCDGKNINLSDDIAELADILIVYRCKCCDKQFDSEMSLLRHVKMGKEFSEKGQSEQTVCVSDDIIITPLSSHNKESFICGKCSKIFSDFSSCQLHIQSHKPGCQNQSNNKSGSNIQPVLSLAITKVSSRDDQDSGLTRHQNGQPDAGQNLEDQDILETPVDSSRQRKDNNLQLEPLARIHKCTIGGCGHRFHTLKEVEIHIKCHNSDPRAMPKFTCFHCDERFPRWGQCAMHLYKAHRVSAGLVTCAVCQTFKTYTAVRLRQHQETHSDQRSHVCPTCNKGFKQAAQLINHRITHVPPAQRQHYKKSYQARVCELCNKTFATPKIYGRHVKQVHNKIRPWWCDLCGHTAATKHALEVHKRIHTGEKPYSCDLCSYKTADHNTLRRHKMKHEGVKPYSCPHCPYTAIQTYSFKSHIKNYHPNLPGVFECPHCPFQSIREDALKSHIQSHNKGLLPIREKKTDDTVFPGNLAATQLLYNCLSALAENGDVTLPNSLESSICQKGSTQTITIHIPQYEENSQESVELGLGS